MRELVETGGLENRCTGNRTGGSNPSPSAIDLPDLQRLPLFYNRPSLFDFPKSGEEKKDRLVEVLSKHLQAQISEISEILTADLC